jgi:hypothetical protein
MVGYLTNTESPTNQNNKGIQLGINYEICQKQAIEFFVCFQGKN